MGAILDAYGFDEAVALAIEAGIDLLLVANQLVYEPDVATRVVDLVERPGDATAGSARSESTPRTGASSRSRAPPERAAGRAVRG